MKLLIVPLLLVMAFVPLAFSQGYGTSAITLSTYNATVLQGSQYTLQYTIKLYSGSTWGTSISLENASALSAKGISASFSNAYGDPPYSGTMTISVASSTQARNYTLNIVATGDDPSIAPAVLHLTVQNLSTVATSVQSTSPTTIQKVAAPLLTTVNSVTSFVNGTRGATVALVNDSIVALIRPGTYVLSGNVMYDNYNFTLALFSVSNIGSPPNESQYTPVGAYAFEVNGKISPQIEFVNASGKPYAIISTVKAGQNTTSWTFLGGAFNGTAYVGGKYAFADNWMHVNSTTMINNVFVKPVMWIFESHVPTTVPSTVTTTSLPTTTKPPAYSSSEYTYVYIIIAIIAVIALVYAYTKLRKH